MKYLLHKKEFRSKNNKLIKEALENSISWGDSLVGRLLFSIFRLAHLGVDKGRIAYQLSQLRKVIENPIFVELRKNDEWSNIESVVKESAAEDAIQNAIEENPEDLKDIIEGLKEEYGEDWLKKFLEDLDPELLAIINAIIEQMGDKKDGDRSEESDPKTYSIMISNLQHLKAAIDNMNNVKLEGEFNKGVNHKGKYYNYTDSGKNGICFVKSQTDISVENGKEEGGIYIFKWNPAIGSQKGHWSGGTQGIYIDASKLGKEIPVDKLSVNKVVPINAKNESLLFEATFGEKQNPAEVKGNESHLTEALTKIRKSLGILISPKEKGIGVDSKFIADILTKSKDPAGKEAVKNLYKEISRFMTGDKSHELTVDALYKEGIETISDKNKVVIVAEKIARFAKRSLQFEGQNLYGGMGAFGKELEQFNTSFNQIMGTFKKKEAVSESLINEGNMESSGSGVGYLSKWVGLKFGGDKIKIENNHYYLDGKEINLDDKFKDNKEKVEGAIKEGEKFEDSLEGKTWTLDAIEIVRIFNKANRIMVRGRVPSVRGEGKISSMKANEWEKITGDSAGDSPSEDGVGPVRNRRLFQQWNDGVLKIIKDNDHILKNVKLLDKDKNPITPKYPITKFMTDALNDMKLFAAMSGRGETGYQSKYLESHLGLTEDDLKSAGLVSGGKTKDNEVEKEDSDKGRKHNTEIPESTLKEETEWTTEEKSMISDGHIYRLTIKNTMNKFGTAHVKELYLVCMKIKGGKALFKVSLGDNFLSAYAHTYKKSSSNKLQDVYTTVLPTNHDFESGKKISGKATRIKDKNDGFEYSLIIEKSDVLTNKNGEVVLRKKVNNMKLNQGDGYLTDLEKVIQDTKSGRLESLSYTQPTYFKKYSDLSKDGKTN